jgi:hypothetical protein
MTRIETLSAILEQVDNASAPCREIDGMISEMLTGVPAWDWHVRAITQYKLDKHSPRIAEVAIVFGRPGDHAMWSLLPVDQDGATFDTETEARNVASAITAPWYICPKPDEVIVYRRAKTSVSPYTASRDAAYRLSQMLLPGFCSALVHNPGAPSPYAASHWEKDRGEVEQFNFVSHSAPLAIIGSAISALIAKLKAE